jgi:RluA family pseudouridine synthase
VSAVIKLSAPATREFWETPILFEDPHLLALDKPAGLLTAPDHDNPGKPSLLMLLHAGIAGGKPWAKERGLSYMMNVHWLDAETSGVLLFARDKPSFTQLANLFGSDKPDRRYLALVRGEPAEHAFEVDAKLAPHPVRPEVIHVDPREGKRSKTNVEVIEKFSGYTLVKCRAFTDRMHQIRVHLWYAGLPVVGDELYGGQKLWLSRLKPNYRLKEGREERPLISSVALHFEHLSLPHPVTGETVTMTAPWPKDLKVAVKYLRQFARKPAVTG